jgi:hypothetical protein
VRASPDVPGPTSDSGPADSSGLTQHGGCRDLAARKQRVVPVVENDVYFEPKVQPTGVLPVLVE